MSTDFKLGPDGLYMAADLTESLLKHDIVQIEERLRAGVFPDDIPVAEAELANLRAKLAAHVLTRGL